MRLLTISRLSALILALCFLLTCFFPASLETTPDLSAITETGLAASSISAEFESSMNLGRIVYQSKEAGTHDIWVMDADGSNQTQLISWPSFEGGPSWSPDGMKIAFSSYIGGGGSNIWVMDSDGRNLIQLTTDPASDCCQDWSPDGRIIFQSERTGKWQLWVMDADGSNQTQLLSTAWMTHHHPTWSPDGKKIAFDGLWVVDADGSNLTQLTSGDAGLYPAWSPDGSRIAYSYSDGGKWADIWVIDADGSNKRPVAIAPECLEFPGWSPDGKKIVYGRADWPVSNIWAIDADGGNAVQLTSDAAPEADPDWAYLPDLNDTSPPIAPVIRSAFLTGTHSENVEVTWHKSTDELQPGGTMKYEVWKAKELSGPYTYASQTPAYGSSIYSYLDVGAGEGDSDDYFYKVFSVDISDNGNGSVEIAGKFIRVLDTGPNLVSIPLIQWNERIEVVLQTVSWDKAWIHDSSIYKWKWNMQSKPYLGELRTLNHRVGVWIDVSEDSNLTVAGVVPVSTTIDLQAGWNLVGFPSFDDNFTVADLKAEVAAERIEGFDGLAPPYCLRIMSDGDFLQTGFGYWIKIESSAIWTVENV